MNVATSKKKFNGAVRRSDQAELLTVRCLINTMHESSSVCKLTANMSLALIFDTSLKSEKKKKDLQCLLLLREPEH